MLPTPRSPLAPKCPHVISFYDAYTDAHSDSVSMVLEYMNAGTLQVCWRLFEIDLTSLYIVSIARR